MRFHNGCHGNNITFSDENSIATRSSSYYHGMIFSDQPYPSGEMVTFQILNENKSWSGSIQFGFTNKNPDDISELPPFSDNFTSKGGTWMKKLSEQHQVVGNKIGLILSNDGSVCLSVNGESVESYDVCGAVDVSEPVWIVMDLVGSVTSVRLLPTDADSIPVEIIARGVQAKKAYQEAVKSGMSNVSKSRLMIIGQDKDSKTCLKKCLFGKRWHFDQHATDTAIDTSTECIITSSDGWKVCGRGENKHQSHMGYTQALAAEIVQKLTSSPESSSPNRHSEASIQSAELPGDDTSTIPDDVTEEVERLLRDQRKAMENVNRMDGRVDENIKMGICSFSEHALAHHLHQVFLSNKAVYIIVFNLTKDLTKKQNQDQDLTTLEYLDSWLCSIFTYTIPNPPCARSLKQLSPPIFIVGTHADSLDSDPKTREKWVDSKFSEIRQYLKDKCYRQHVVNPFYAFGDSLDDSQSEKEAISFRKHIMSVLREEPYMDDSVPLRWLQFDDAIQEEIGKGTPYLTRKQVTELTVSAGLDSDEDLSVLLHFYHEIGQILYFGGENCDEEALRNLIILDPTWLMDVMKKVITVVEDKDQWPIHVKAWSRLESHGILEDILLDHMWSDFIGLKAALIAIMLRFDLLCLLSEVSTDSGGVCYNVPSLLKCKVADDGCHDYSGSKQNASVFYVDFEGFLPDGLFHQLQASLVSWSQSQGGYEPSLHYSHVSLYVDDLHQMELTMSTGHHARITVVITKHVVVKTTEDEDEKQENLKPSPESCSKVKDFICSTLAELKNSYTRPVSFSIHIDCPCNTGAPHTLDLDECLCRKIIMCARRRPIDTAGIKKQFQDLEDRFTSSEGSSDLASDITSSTASSSGISSTGSFSSVDSENALVTVLETDLKIQKRLGAGGFGTVFLAKHKHWGDVAVKRLDCSSGVLSEAKQMWRTIFHHCLVRIMGVIDDPRQPSIIMEFSKHGSLKTFMKYMVDISTLPRRVEIILDVVTGMNYLHTLKSPIIHRDLKCDNVYIGEGFKAKIGDLGLAVNTASVKSRGRAELAGTLSHIPPEVFAGTISKPTKEWDVYSFGITLHEILSNGKDPWPQLNIYANTMLLSHWVTNGHRPNLEAIPDTMPSDLLGIMKNCWDGEQAKRPSFQDLLKQLGNIFTSKYEKNIYQADKTIMDSITNEKHTANPEKRSMASDDDW